MTEGVFHQGLSSVISHVPNLLVVMLWHMRHLVCVTETSATYRKWPPRLYAHDGPSEQQHTK